MPLAWLIRMVLSGKYAEDLQDLRIEELRRGPDLSFYLAPGEKQEHAVLRVFQACEGQWLSSGFFVRYLNLERWTAQKICVDLASNGLLERQGRTSATRYRLADSNIEGATAR